MEQIHGFVVQRDSSTVVGHLHMSLYILNQSSRVLFHKYHNIVIHFGMIHSKVDYAVLYHESPQGSIYLNFKMALSIENNSSRQSRHTILVSFIYHGSSIQGYQMKYALNILKKLSYRMPNLWILLWMAMGNCYPIR